MNGAAVAEDHGLFLVADLAEFLAVGDDHGKFFPRLSKFCANLSDGAQKGKPAGPMGHPAARKSGYPETAS
jgi:hypothetical protein